MVAPVGDPGEPVIIFTPKAHGVELTSSYEEEEAALLLALDWARANCPTERISANPYFRLFRAAHTTPSLFASDKTTGKASPPLSGFQVTRAYRATRPLTNLLKQLPAPPTFREDIPSFQ